MYNKDVVDANENEDDSRGHVKKDKRWEATEDKENRDENRREAHRPAFGDAGGPSDQLKDVIFGKQELSMEEYLFCIVSSSFEREER